MVPLVEGFVVPARFERLRREGHHGAHRGDGLVGDVVGGGEGVLHFRGVFVHPLAVHLVGRGGDRDDGAGEEAQVYGMGVAIG